MHLKQSLITVLTITSFVFTAGCSDDDKDKKETNKFTVPMTPEERAIGSVSPNVIYGADDRLDLYQVTDSQMLELADSTVGLIQRGKVSTNSDGSKKLELESYAGYYNLCSSEPFYDQMMGPHCSGFLVSDDTIVTAGHCIENQNDCNDTDFVFGFGIKTRGGKSPDTFSANDVYSCKSVVKSLLANGSDFAVVKLDRKVVGHSPVSLRTSGAVAVGAPLTVIGHPAGLPTKVAGGASVRSINTTYIVANLDTYGGNSGSAVFNTDTKAVEGILVRGEEDYVYRNGCAVSNQCANSACRGEDVTKISEVLPFLN